MEAVREAVKVIEEELILNYNDNTTNPVSSAFVGLPDTETQEGKQTNHDVFSTLDWSHCDFLLDQIAKQPDDTPLSNEDLSPIMDSMYQVAIEEMVEKAFSSADVNKDGKITYEEFRYFAASYLV